MYARINSCSERQDGREITVKEFPLLRCLETMFTPARMVMRNFTEKSLTASQASMEVGTHSQTTLQRHAAVTQNQLRTVE